MLVRDFDWESCSPVSVKVSRRNVALSSSPKLIIVIDEAETTLATWTDLPADILLAVLHALLLLDKQAPRVATVQSSWAAGMASCLKDYCGGKHLWWSPPLDPLLPHLEVSEASSDDADVRCSHHRTRLSKPAYRDSWSCLCLATGRVPTSFSSPSDVLRVWCMACSRVATLRVFAPPSSPRCSRAQRNG